MAPLVVPSTFQVIVSGTISGRPWVNVFGIHTVAAPALTQAGADAIGAAFSGPWSVLGGNFSEQWVCNEIVVKDIRTLGAPAFIADVDTFDGGSSDHPLPSNSCIAVSWRTAFNTRRGRGRTYLSGFIAQHIDEFGKLASDIAGDIQTWAEDIRFNLSELDLGELSLAVVSRADGVSRPVVSQSVNRDFDHQDRRKAS